MERSERPVASVEHSNPSVDEQKPPTHAPDAHKFSAQGPLPAVREDVAPAGPSASEQGFDDGQKDTTGLPKQIAAHITKGAGGVQITTDAVPALAGGIWIGRSSNDGVPTQTGVVDKTGRVHVTLPAPRARSMVSLGLLIQSPDRKHAFRLDCGFDALAIGDEETGETKITKPVRQLVRSEGGISPYEMTIGDGNAFTNADLDHAGVAVAPKDHLEGTSSIRAGRGHIHIPGARAARGTAQATVINTTTGATVTSGFLRPDGSFDLDFPLEEDAKYAVQVSFWDSNVRYLGASFHGQDGTNPLLLLKL